MCLTWGVMHVSPTMAVVKGFMNISEDNRNIILMEWVNEGLTLAFIGILVISVALAERAPGRIARIVLGSAAVMLFCLAGVSLFTGFKISLLPFKLCPLIFALSGLLILQGIFTKSVDARTLPRNH